MVFVERGNLLRAEACLRHTHRLARHEEYVLRHLKIVQSRIAKLTDEEMAEQGTAAPDAEYDRFIASLPESDDDIDEPATPEEIPSPTS